MSFFLWRFFLSLFLRLCVAILCRFLFLPQGIFFCSYTIVLFDTCSQFLRWFKSGRTAAGNLYLRTRPRIAPCPRSPDNGSKGAKSSNLNVFTLLHSCNYRLDETVDNHSRVGLCKACSLSNLPHYISFGQAALP